MGRAAYDYRGLKAASWDLLRGDTSRWPDRRFFRDLIARHGEPVLDVSCAAGRLLLDYRAAGVDIDGVDASPEMVTLCREKAGRLGLRATVYVQAMEALDLPRRYRTVLVPSSSFQLLTDLDVARAAMRRFLAHLEPGGALAMPFMVPWRPGEPERTDWRLAAEAVRPEDGATVRRWARTWCEPAARLEHAEDRYELLCDGRLEISEEHRRSPAARWYTQEQVRALYREAGFDEPRLFRGFSHAPAPPEDALFTAVGTRR